MFVKGREKLNADSTFKGKNNYILFHHYIDEHIHLKQFILTEIFIESK